MSDHERNRSPLMRNADTTHQQQSTTDSSLNVTLEETSGVENTSIIGKVRSRVSSILPNSLSKWFSPSGTSNAETVNGGVTTRRRRRLELDDDEDEEEEEDCMDGEEEEIEFDDEAVRNTQLQEAYAGNLLSVDQADNTDEDTAEHDEQNQKVSRVPNSHRQLSAIHRSHGVRPPSKRSRLNWNESDMLQPIVSSTPAFNTPTVNDARSKSRYSSYLNLYGHQSKKEAPYDFFAAANMATPISNSSRRTLNIPTTLQTCGTTSPMTDRYSNLAPTKRQSLGSIREDFTIGASTPEMCKPHTATTIVEIDAAEDDDDDMPSTSKGLLARRINGPYAKAMTSLVSTPTSFANQQRKKLNGSAIDEEEAADVQLRDSASECSEGADSSSLVAQGKTGLFNVNALKSGQNSRTSSFGNGLNFYSHLEGRKSLFAGNQPSSFGGQNFNNSTLSLTSLNRRQFNASIYGSTSALSDSRLLNTFSPFYKGKTTYGGAAAYNKFGLRGAVAGAGANAAHITPTLIRPTSSLSALSGSCNSLAGTSTAAAAAGGTSSTAARLLEMINDFTTPLSDVKKMANSINMPHQKPRLCEADLQASRSLRLSKISTPYDRPAVMMARNNMNGLSAAAAASLPPVRELQVPSMSQLLQMKKFQKTTERARQITTMQNDDNHKLSSNEDYTLPIAEGVDAADACKMPQTHYTNKMKHKITSNVARVTSKPIDDEVALAAPNLPNIAFPAMQSVPKIDIALPVSAATSINSGSSITVNAKPVDKQQTSWSSASKLISNVKGVEMTTAKRTTTPFEFSAPSKLSNENTVTQHIAPIIENNFKFSCPLGINVDQSKPTTATATAKLIKLPSVDNTAKLPEVLRSDSGFDALKKPLEVAAAATKPLPLSVQFKQCSDEWNCDVCMVRNKKSSSKCVACENPQPGVAPKATVTSQLTVGSNSKSSNFGASFKPKTNEWSCPTCLIYNKKEHNECVACQTKQPGVTTTIVAAAAATKTTQSNFKFGFAANAEADDSFKTLVQQQKASKWECEACMTRNDDACLKCVCCEQAKPGTLNSADSDAPKFAFGATAKSKFIFGFGTTQNAPTELELRSGNANAPTAAASLVTLAKKEKTDAAPTSGFVFAAENKTATVAPTGFSFGIKPIATSSTATSTTLTSLTAASDAKSNALNQNTTTDNKNAATSGFGGFKFGTTTTITTTATSTAGSGFSFGIPKVTATTAITTTTTATNVAVSAAPTANINASTNVKFALPESSSSSNTNAVTTTAVAAPSFTFASASTNAPAANAMLSFGTTKAADANQTAAIAAPASGFKFAMPTSTASSTNNFAFGAIAATTTTAATNCNSPASSLGTTTAGTTTTPSKPSLNFGTSSPSSGFNFASPSNQLVGSAFGGATAPKIAATANIFGSAFGNADGKPTAVTQPMFGNVSSSSGSTNLPAATVSPFAFSSNVSATTAAATTTTDNSNTLAWQKSSFTFGANNNATVANAATANSKTMFGSFAGAQTNTQASGFVPTAPASNATSVFVRLGAPASSTTTTASGGSNVFGGNTLLGTQSSNNNLFTAAASTNSAASPFGGATAFGSGGNTFGSTVAAAPVNTFSGFGASSNSNNNNNSSTDGATAAKKADVPAFNFGATSVQPAAATTGFNFNAAATTVKPAFNFTASNPPAFNFTGSAENQTAIDRPFQFGATPAAPIFNFSSGVAETTTTNAPFQFNAGATPSTNIFAPTPSPNSPNAVQVRRKMRAPMRRMNQR